MDNKNKNKKQKNTIPNIKKKSVSKTGTKTVSKTISKTLFTDVLCLTELVACSFENHDNSSNFKTVDTMNDNCNCNQ